jgi:hypothetical protein
MMAALARMMSGAGGAWKPFLLIGCIRKCDTREPEHGLTFI